MASLAAVNVQIVTIPVVEIAPAPRLPQAT
jgi:hypothetical protein